MTNDALDCFTVPVQVTRPSGSVIYTRGRAVQAASTTFMIEGSVQPMTPEKLQELPELERTSESRIIYTEAALRAASVQNKTAADMVKYRGEDWKVVSVKTHDEGILDHAEVVIQRVGKG